jgi:hypothetical protein
MKFNSGRGAFICDICRVIIKEYLTKEDIDSCEINNIHFCEDHERYRNCNKYQLYYLQNNEHHSLDGFDDWFEKLKKSKPSID